MVNGRPHEFKHRLSHIEQLVEDPSNRAVPLALEKCQPCWGHVILMLSVEVKRAKGSHLEAVARHRPDILTEIYGAVLLEEQEDEAMVAGSHGREGGQVMAYLLARLDVIAWNVCHQPVEVLRISVS